jgi:16S rRNA (cytosine1402-N4)-methyltransferase
MPILSHEIRRFLSKDGGPLHVLGGSGNLSGLRPFARRPLRRARYVRSREMTAKGGSAAAVAGGVARHVPVLGAPALAMLSVHDDGVYIDGTFGAGGYSSAILAAADCKVVGIDRDQSAIAFGADLVEAANGRLTLIEERFSNLDDAAHDAGFAAADGVVLDLGVSSMQLDQAERGFSFRLDGPLDMRMGGDGPSAADVVAAAGERDLANIIFILGEERHSRSVARAIVRARAQAPIRTTKALADIVAAVVHSRPGDIHPATRTFQALRIFVNDELGELVSALCAAERVLKPQGRLVVVSFHSLEDRIVKSFLTSRSETRAGSRHAPELKHPAPTFRVLTKRPVVADADEIARNPRSRSAKLRAAERSEAPARNDDASELLPRLPSLADVLKGR